MFNLLRVVAQRLALGLFTLFIVSLIIASIVELLPGDITQAILGKSATPETVAVFRAELGIDRPVHERYIEWLKGMVTGDMGRSLANRREIAELVGVRLSNTLFLGGFAAAIAVPLSLILGLLAALYRNSIFDRGVNLFTLTSISFPEFFVAYILILFFAQIGLGAAAFCVRFCRSRDDGDILRSELPLEWFGRHHECGFAEVGLRAAAF